MDENYLTPAELRAVADACEALKPLWELLTEGPRNGVSFDQGLQATYVYCYDSNGDKLGFISWAEDGPGFFLSPETEKAV